jgi:hypothetical protein
MAEKKSIKFATEAGKTRGQGDKGTRGQGDKETRRGETRRENAYW